MGDTLTPMFTGVVTPPPGIGDILAKLAGAVQFKQEVTLTPAEVRVLHDHLEGF